MFRSIVLLVAGLASLNTVSLFAQDAILGQKYGRGVHAYFTGDDLKAHEQLTAAIDGGSKDPRVFYFRGLAYLKLGRSQEAMQDFQKGADLESRDVNKFYNVSKALERVQGQARIALENYRVDARMAALEDAERARKARYDAILREEPRVLREQPAVPETVATPDANAEPAADDPFAAPEEKPAPKADAKPAKSAKKPAAKPADDVFGEKPADEADAAKAEGDDPFADEPAKKADATKPAKKGNLLGAMGKALGKAVGGDADDKPADEPKKDAKPAAKEKEEAADASDPFLDETPAVEKKTDAGDKAADEKPAKEEADPDDPFAN